MTPSGIEPINFRFVAQCLYQQKMFGTRIKITEAQQARIYNNYKNTRLKVPKKNAAIWFNKICKTKQLTAKYFSIKINGNNSKTS
jgi:hypothetical protein